MPRASISLTMWCRYGTARPKVRSRYSGLFAYQLTWMSIWRDSTSSSLKPARMRSKTSGYCSGVRPASVCDPAAAAVTASVASLAGTSVAPESSETASVAGTSATAAFGDETCALRALDLACDCGTTGGLPASGAGAATGVTVVAMGSLGVSLGAVAQALKATAVTTNDKSQDAGT